MNRTLVMLGICALLLGAGSVSAKTARSFDERVYLESSGRAAVIWTITGLKDSSCEVLLPWPFAGEPAALSVAPGGGLHVRVVAFEGSSFLSLRSSERIDLDTVIIAFEIPGMFPFASAKKGDFGNYSLKKKFVNTTLIGIQKFSSEFFLPPGFDIASVEETLPEKPAGESASPYDIVRFNDRNGISIAMDSAGVGDAVYFKMKVKSSEKSPLLFIIFVCVGIAYLVIFRDTVFAPNSAPPPATSH